MTILYIDDSGPIIWPDTDCHDPSSKKDYFLYYGPFQHATSVPYVKGIDTIFPEVPNGCMYECVSGGISGSITPIWGTEENKITEDGGVKWKCLPISSRLNPGDSITTSTWTGDTGVTQDTPAILSGVATVTRVTTVPTGVTKFTITNHITILRVSGRTEEFEKSVIIKIKDL